MKYKLIIFDMDGTILDTLRDLADALNYALAESAYPLRTIEEVRRFIGNGVRKLVERGMPAGADEKAREKVYDDFNRYYRIHCSDHTRPYEGIETLLSALRKAGCLTAVVSNKADYGVQQLCAQFFDGLFDLAAGEREGIAKKPAPDLVNAVLRELKISREEAVYIGDSEVDLETAANAGMNCITVSWGFRGEAFLREHKAPLVVNSMEELERVLLTPGSPS